jgi:hypothetical protein
MSYPRPNWKKSLPDYQAGLTTAISRLESKTGFKVDPQTQIPPEMTFREWCEKLGREGLKVDSFPFSLKNRPAMWFIYDLIPTSISAAFKKRVIIMKCSQVGFTVMEMLAAIYMGVKFEPCKIGLYLPDMSLAAAKSSERFIPVVRSIPKIHRRLGSARIDADGNVVATRANEGNVMIRTMGDSRFHFLWTSGKAMTESFPFDVLTFDEVQEMTPGDIEKTDERLSASRIRFRLLGSTANWPDADIHFWFKQGTQHQFHTECPSCLKSNILDEYFPDCIQYDSEMRDYRYVCKHCNSWIDDTQKGEWIAKNQEAPFVSVHFPQFLSPTISARDIIEAYNSAEDMKNFYNRKLGKPYTDPSQVPVTLEILNDCARLGMAAGLVWKQKATGTFMGIDQMGCFNVVIIKERTKDGRQAVIHLEYIFDPDPFQRCDTLMYAYGVQCCVVETLPNYNDAKRFASRHSGKVFLASYARIEEGMMRWGDAPKLDVSERRTDDKERDRYTVSLDQYKCMQVAMARFTKRLCLFPDPASLVQDYIEKGIKKLVAVCKEVAFFHFTKTALVTEKDDEQKLYRRKVVKVGIDPHTSYANMLCDVAWARAYGTSQFILPTAEKSDEASKLQALVEKRMPGLPKQVVEMIDIPPANEVCGNCTAFNAQTGQCTERLLIVSARDPGCPLFVAKERAD